jgi:hypothetical protein
MNIRIKMAKRKFEILKQANLWANTQTAGDVMEWDNSQNIDMWKLEYASAVEGQSSKN